MKTLTTLSIAILAIQAALAQPAVIPARPITSSQRMPADKARPLTHEDSLVLAEVTASRETSLPGNSLPGVRSSGVSAPAGSDTDRSDAGEKMEVRTYSRADSIRITDSLARRDSVFRANTRVLPFNDAINAVLQDFPHNLRHITGELILAQGEFENYASMVVLPGADNNCIITRYHSWEDTTVSWQAKMYTGDEFARADQVYRDLYKKLQHCYVRLVDGSVIYLSGTWEPAKEEASFTTSTLRLVTGDWRYKEVKVELELVYLMADWAVNINIVTKKRDDEVGGGHVGELMQ